MPKLKDLNETIWIHFGQLVSLDRLILNGQKLMKNAKIQNLKCDIFGDFQTLCSNVLCVTRLPLPYFFLMIDLWV